jgi:hypothetical protein
MRFSRVLITEAAYAVERANRMYGYELEFSFTSGHDGCFRGRIIPTSSRSHGARRSWTGRRIKAACWHAHRDVLLALFLDHPEARVFTSMASYVGVEGFKATYPDTAYRNIGSELQPAFMPDLCECDGGLALPVPQRSSVGVHPRVIATEIAARLALIDAEFGWGDAQVVTFEQEEVEA